MSKLSIITINYNNLLGLQKTMQSVINQSWKEFEFIVIDGGSADGSAAFIESQSKDIDIWVSESDKGIYNAMNKGILKATGDYLLFLNSGDHFYSDTTLQENRSKLENYDLIYFSVEVAGSEMSTIISYPQKLIFSDFFVGTLCHQSTFIKKELFNKIGLYDENLRFVSDWKFFIIALFKYNCSYLKVDAILASYYLDGISSDFTNREALYGERKQVLNEDFKGYIEDMNQLIEAKSIISNFKKSKKIALLVKLGLLNKF